MNGGKKWMTVVTHEQYDWIKDTAKEVGIKGSDVLRELIDRARNEDSKRFINSLAEIQLKIQLQQLNDKKAALLEEEKELKRKFSGNKVAA